MQLVWPLYVVIVVVSIEAATETNSSYTPKEHPCHCPAEGCQPHDSSPYDKVRVYKSISRRDKIFCFSYQPIRWTFGSSRQMPSVEPGEVRFRSSSLQRGSGHLFCLTLRVIPQFTSWNASTLFARCEANENDEVSSRWYKLSPEWEFKGQAFDFNPNVTLSPKTSIEEAVKTTEEPSTNFTISVKPFQNTTQHSTVDHPPSVPLTIVIAAAGGAAAFFVILLTLVVVRH